MWTGDKALFTSYRSLAPTGSKQKPSVVEAVYVA